jgi:hypothetical protein
VAGVAIELSDRRWTPEKARLTIYEGPELRSEEIGLGRGWANVTRTGEDVTERLLAEARPPPVVQTFKDEIAAGCAEGPMELHRLVDLAGERHPQARASEQLALAEQAVWELLHEGRVSLTMNGARIDRSCWRDALLSWATWTQPEVCIQAP